MYLKGRSPSVGQRLDSLPVRDVFICSVVKQELTYGAMRSNRRDKALTEQSAFFETYDSLPFNDAAAVMAGREKARLAKLGTPIGPHDLQIAGIALANGLALVTHNIREFQRIQGLQVEDWER